MVAIIAILAGMLLPALNKAREAAKKNNCLGNLRQVGVAISMYVTDSNEYLFPKNNYTSYFVWQNIIDSMYVSKRPLSYNTVYSKIWVCPSKDTSKKNSNNGYDATNCGTITNSALFYESGSPAGYGLKIGTVKLPSQKILAYEAKKITGSLDCISVYHCSYFAVVSYSKHGNGSNFVNVDGSTAFRDDYSNYRSLEHVATTDPSKFRCLPWYPTRILHQWK